jgi:hypothetical protein
MCVHDVHSLKGCAKWLYWSEEATKCSEIRLFTWAKLYLTWLKDRYSKAFSVINLAGGLNLAALRVPLPSDDQLKNFCEGQTKTALVLDF